MDRGVGYVLLMLGGLMLVVPLFTLQFGWDDPFVGILSGSVTVAIIAWALGPTGDEKPGDS